MAKTDEQINEKEVSDKLHSRIKLMKWREIKEAGINCNQALRIRKGETVSFRGETLRRLSKIVK